MYISKILKAPLNNLIHISLILVKIALLVEQLSKAALQKTFQYLEYEKVMKLLAFKFARIIAILHVRLHMLKYWVVSYIDPHGIGNRKEVLVARLEIAKFSIAIEYMKCILKATLPTCYKF